MATLMHERLAEQEDPHGFALFVASRGVEAVLQAVMRERYLTTQQLGHQPFDEGIVAGFLSQATEGLGANIMPADPTKLLDEIPEGVVMSGANTTVLTRRSLIARDYPTRARAARKYAEAKGLLEYEVGDPLVETAVQDLEGELESLVRPVLESDVTNLDPSTFNTGELNDRGEPILDAKKIRIYDGTLVEAAKLQRKAQEKGLTRSQTTETYWRVKNRLIAEIREAVKEEE